MTVACVRHSSQGGDPDPFRPALRFFRSGPSGSCPPGTGKRMGDRSDRQARPTGKGGRAAIARQRNKSGVGVCQGGQDKVSIASPREPPLRRGRGLCAFFPGEQGGKGRGRQGAPSGAMAAPAGTGREGKKATGTARWRKDCNRRLKGAASRTRPRGRSDARGNGQGGADNDNIMTPWGQTCAKDRGKSHPPGRRAGGTGFSGLRKGGRRTFGAIRGPAFRKAGAPLRGL